MKDTMDKCCITISKNTMAKKDMGFTEFWKKSTTARNNCPEMEVQLETKETGECFHVQH